MDLAVGAREVWVLMRHFDPGGSAKFVDRCSFPLTAAGVVRRVYTDLATIRLPGGAAPILDWRSASLSDADLCRVFPPAMSKAIAGSFTAAGLA
jgi:hypothetical protein